jgi:hypothetical protein
MSILTKTQVKNIFVTNAVPQQVDYSNWIDSCVFLNADGSSTIQSLIMPDTEEFLVNVPAVGYKRLFFNQTNNDYLSIMVESGLISEVSPNHTISKSINQSSAGTFYLMHTPYISSLISVKSSIIGIGSFDLKVFKVGGSGPLSGAVQLINTLSVNSSSITDFTSASGVITVSYIQLSQLIGIEISNITGTFDGTVSIEYR